MEPVGRTSADVAAIGGAKTSVGSLLLTLPLPTAPGWCFFAFAMYMIE